jgi:hypothetical protein
MMPSVKGEGAKRAGFGETERSLRLEEGRGGTLGILGAAALSLPLVGRGGTAGVCCIVAAVLIAGNARSRELTPGPDGKLVGREIGAKLEGGGSLCLQTGVSV